MKKKFYNSTEWGIQESNLDTLRAEGQKRLRRMGCKTGKFYSLTIEEAIKDQEALESIFGDDLPFLVLLEPRKRNDEKLGEFGIRDQKGLYELIKRLPAEKWRDYRISFIEEIQETKGSFVGTAISDGKGRLYIECLPGTTNSKQLTSTGADSAELDTCYFSDFDTISKFPEKIPIEMIEEIRKSCHHFKGYFEFVRGKSKDKEDIYYTFYSNIPDYLNILDRQSYSFEEEMDSRLKYRAAMEKRYFGDNKGTKEDELR